MEKISRIELDALVYLKMAKDDTFGHLYGVDYDHLLIITNAVPVQDENDNKLKPCFEELHYETNLVGFYSCDDLRNLIEIQFEKQSQNQKMVGLALMDGRIQAFRLSDEYMKTRKCDYVFEFIDVHVKNFGLIDAALLSVDSGKRTNFAVSEARILETLSDLSESLQQENWKYQNYYKNMRKGKSEPATDFMVLKQLMTFNCDAIAK
jgi:hypothetical protein